jgi:hypothetical protein
VSIDKARERVNAATPGPWWYDEDEDCWRLHGVAMRMLPPFEGFPEQIVNKQIIKAPKRDTPYAEYWPEPADAEFIVRARTEYPLALDVIEAAKELRLNLGHPGGGYGGYLDQRLKRAIDAFEAAIE